MTRSKGVGPSVTQVIEEMGFAPDFSFVNPYLLERARKVGTEVHNAIHMAHRGKLDEDLISDEATPYWHAWKLFNWQNEPKILEIEQNMQVTGAMPYHGRYDMLVELWPDDPRCSGPPWLLDVKTSTSINKRYCALQMAGYSAVFDNAPRHGILHLKGNGDFRLIELDKTLIEQADRAFASILMAWYAVDSARQAVKGIELKRGKSGKQD